MTTNVLTSAIPAPWYDTLEYPPPYGDRLQCLTIGGCQVSAILNRDNIDHFVAWAPHMRVGKKTKDRLSRLWGGGA